jgi:hypothetical protein
MVVCDRSNKCWVNIPFVQGRAGLSVSLTATGTVIMKSVCLIRYPPVWFALVSKLLLALKSLVFWDITTRGLLKVNHIASIFRVEEEAKLCLLPASRLYLAWLILPLRWWRHVPPKHDWFLKEDARFEVFTAVTMKNAVFWDVALCSSSVKRCLQPPAHAGSSLADFSTLKMEAIRSSETSVHRRTAKPIKRHFKGTTGRYIPEDRIPHNHGCENINSYIISIICKTPWL